MRNIVLMLSLIVALTSCRSFEVVVDNDKFKQSAVVKADMWHKVTDRRIDNRRVLYQKEIKNGKMTEPVVSFEFFAINSLWHGYSGEPLGNDVYMLLDDKSFKVKLVDAVNTQQHAVGSSTSTNVATGGQQTNVYTTVSNTLLGKVVLTPDIQEAILNCKTYMIRLYTGNDPLTLEATSDQLKAVKKFISVNPSNLAEFKK